MAKALSALLLCNLLFSTTTMAEVPQECIQAPTREALCPHTLYRVAKVAVPSLAIVEGGMVCLCLSDLTDLPVQEQRSAFSAIAREYALPPLALYQLLEVTPPDWASQTSQ